MQIGPGPQAKPPIGIIFDCDMGNRIDDVLALALLYGLDNKSQARVVAVSVSKANLKAAAAAEAIVRFYVTATMGQFASFARTLPIGFADDGTGPEDTPILKAITEKRDDQGKPVYPNSIAKVNDTAEPGPLIRNALTAQHDGNAAVVMLGPATNLAKTLAVPGAREVITRKARMLVVGASGRSLAADAAAAKKVFTEWPTPIVICDADIGTVLKYPGASIETDYGWAPSHPVVDAYRAFQPMPYDAPAGAMAAVLHAVRCHRKYFQQSDPGTASLSADGKLIFTADANGKHRRLMPDPAQIDAVVKIFTEYASAKPVPRRPRFLQQQQQQQPDPAKPKPSDVKPPST